MIEILRLLYCTNEESNDVIGGSTKAVHVLHSIKNTCISRNIKATAVFFKLGSRIQQTYGKEL